MRPNFEIAEDCVADQPQRCDWSFGHSRAPAKSGHYRVVLPMRSS